MDSPCAMVLNRWREPLLTVDDTEVRSLLTGSGAIESRLIVVGDCFDA